MISPHELVATNVTLLRTERGWTQREFLQRMADECGLFMEQAAFSRKEAAVRMISLDEAVVFAAVLRVSPCDLLLPREPRGELALSDAVSVSFSTVRSWVRGHRQLPLDIDDLPEGSIELPDVELRRQAGGLRARQRELSATIERVEQRISSAQHALGEHESQQLLFEDPHAAQVRQGLHSRYEQAVIDHGHAVHELNEVREQSRKLHKDAIASGWLDEADAEILLTDADLSASKRSTEPLRMRRSIKQGFDHEGIAH